MCFKDGKVVEFGSHEELLAIEDGVYGKYVARQHGRDDSTASSDTAHAPMQDISTSADEEAEIKVEAKATTPQRGAKRMLRQASAPQVRRAHSAPESRSSPKALSRLFRSWAREDVTDPMSMNVATLQERLQVIETQIVAAEGLKPEGAIAQLRDVLDQMHKEGCRLTARIKNIDRSGQRERTDAFSGPPRRRVTFAHVADELRVGDELLSRTGHHVDHHSGVFASKVAASNPRRAAGGVSLSRAPLAGQIDDRSLGLAPPALNRTQSMF